MSDIVLIYDGQCELCKNSISWVRKELAITALDFHTTELSQFNLSSEQCSREVFLLHEQIRLSGAPAVAYVLKARGNTVMAAIITALGPVSRFMYRWVANHRNSLPVKALSRWLSARSQP